jgi:ElaB/YqjD/DUF883 family membrane-anchored ribosome-binding protein
VEFKVWEIVKLNKGEDIMTTENQSRTSNAKISEALELLNEAAKEKKDELKGIIADRYSHFHEAMTAGVDHGRDVFKHSQDLAQEAIVHGKERVIEIAGDLDKRVHKEPWTYIAGAAVTSLILGYLMGSNRK